MLSPICVLSPRNNNSSGVDAAGQPVISSAMSPPTFAIEVSSSLSKGGGSVSGGGGGAGAVPVQAQGQGQVQRGGAVVPPTTTSALDLRPRALSFKESRAAAAAALSLSSTTTSTSKPTLSSARLPPSKTAAMASTTDSSATTALPPLANPATAISAGLLVGIRNVGNTCYLAAALNALSAIPDLYSFFAPSGAWRSCLGASREGSGGDLAAALSAFLREASGAASPRLAIERELRKLVGAVKGGGRIALPQRLSSAAIASALTPAPLKAVCARANAFVFNNRQQQDAQEALSFLLDTLHEDTNAMPAASRRYETDVDDAAAARLRAAAAAAARAGVLTPALALAGPALAGDCALASDAWARHARRSASKVASLTHGLLANRVACVACSTQSLRFDVFTLLSLPLGDESPSTSSQQQQSSVSSPAAMTYTPSPTPTASPLLPPPVRILVTLVPRDGSAVEVSLTLPSGATARDVGEALGLLAGAQGANVWLGVAQRAGGEGGGPAAYAFLENFRPIHSWAAQQALAKHSSPSNLS